MNFLKKRVVHIDMDDTITNFQQHLKKMYEKEEKKPFPEGLDWFDTGDLLRKYWEKKYVFKNLVPLDNGCLEVIQRLSRRYNVYFVTVPPTTHSAVEKLVWVNRHFPYMLSKVKMVKHKDIEGDIMLDDSPVYLNQFKGIRVLYEQPYNSNVDCNYSVSNFYEFESIVESLFGGGR